MNKYIHTTLRGSFIAIMMMMMGVSMWAQNGTNVAKIGETEYATLQAAIDAAEADATIELIADINETVANTTNANCFTIDLGNHTWTYTQTENDYAALKQDKDGSVITLKNGNMVVSGTEGFNVWARNGKVIIESGTYTISSHEDYNIYATTGYVEIYGGTFTNSDTEPYNHNGSLKSLNLNVHNSLSTSANIKVYGGTFTADPSMGDDSSWGTSTFVVPGYIVKTHDATPQTTYTVEPEVEVEINLPGEATQDQTDAATALAGNTSVGETTGLGDNGSLDVSITGVTLDDNKNVTSATFEVTAKDANGNAISADGTYTFRLPISAGIVAGKWVNLTHDGSPITGNTVEVDGANKYVTVTTTSFSPFGYDVLPTDPVAQIGETKYVTIAAAITAAQDGAETTIELIADVTEDIIILTGKNIVLKGEAYTLTGSITNNGTFKIVSGIFTTQPDAAWIDEDHEVMLTAEDKYEVAAAGTAEAQIDDLKYKSIGKAILTAGANETTIKLLKDVAADAITIPADAKITFDAVGVTITKRITCNGTLNISNGTYQAAITADSPAVVNITGGTFYVKPTGYHCEEGYDLVVNAEGHYVVGNVANAEAQIGEEKYMTIGDAIAVAVAGTDATTITLLKDPASEITIPSGADITLLINNGATFESLTKAITVNGTLAITSGTISGTITIANFNGKINITDGVTLTNTAVALSDALATDNVLKSKTNDAAPVVTSYWVEKKFEAKVSLSNEATTEQTSAANTLANNNAISTVSGLTTNQSLIITVTGVTLSGSNVKAATFDVKLIGADGEAITNELTTAVGFNLPILYSSASSTTWVNLWHDTTPIQGTNNILGTGDNQYITLSSTSFSPFSYEIVENPIAQIGETKYETVTAAIDKATATETEIKLLRDVDAQTAISVSSGQNVKLTIGTHTVSGDITNAGTLTIWNETNDGGTNGVISGTITNTRTLNISDNANVSGAITATAGTVTVSGGTVHLGNTPNSTITTSNNAGLVISGGTIDHDITVGGSGTNTISGTANVSGSISVNTATLTISGGTFSNSITATGTDDSNKGIINISGGTFTGTITEGANSDVAISGGTHSVLPTPALCATGYMPIKNDDNATYGMTNSWPVVDDTDLTKNAHLKDGTYSVATATYTRNSGMVSAGNAATKYGTICLPFEITAQPSGMTLYKATSISGNTLNIDAVNFTNNTTVPAGTPLIFQLGEAAKTLTVTSGNATVNTTPPATTAATGNLLIGTYSGTTINTGLENIYYLNGDAFHQAVNSLTVPKFRAYLYYETPSSNAPMPNVLYISSESNAETGLTETFEMESVTEVFDLNGRKQSGLQKGMNIVRRADGSSFKVIVK